MQKSTYPPEKITVKVQNNSQAASKKSVFQRLGSKSKLAAAGDLSLEEQCKELRRQIKMEGGGGSSSTRKRAQKRHKESSSSSEDSSSGSSSDSSSSSSSSQSSPTRRRSKKARKPHHHHHHHHSSSSAVDHLAAKIRKTSASSHRPVAKVPASAASSSSTSKLAKKHKPSRVVESPPPPPPTSSSRQRRSASPAASPTHRSRSHASHDLKKRDHHRSKELLHPKDSSRSDRDPHSSSSASRLQHDSRGRSRSPRHLPRPVRDQKRRLSPLEAKRGHSPRAAPVRSVDRDRERREKEREEREMARNKEREEALLRCQERQRERERVARERERKETRSREKSVDREKPRPHLSSDRRSGGREVLASGSRANYERRGSPPPGDAYDYEQRSTGGESYRASSSVGGRGGGGGHREREPPVYEKEYVRGGGGSLRGRSPPPYEEVNAPPMPSRSAHLEKYRGSAVGVAGYEYEPREAVRGVGGGGGYGEVRGWEEEKAHKAREPVPARERILDRAAKEWSGPGGYRGSAGVDGPKEWSSGGNSKWEGQKFGGGGISGRDDNVWPSNRGGGGIGVGEPHLGGKAENSWRNSGAYQEDGPPPPPSSTPSWKESHSTGGGHYNYGGHHNQQQQHHPHPGAPGQQQQGPRMMMGPRYNDSWHHKPRFGAKKEFYPRHTFQAGGGGGGQHEGPGGDQQQPHPRFANQQKRFGEYQSFAPRGMMNQGPKFSAHTHGHQAVGQQTALAPVAEKPRPEVPVATPPAAIATAAVPTPSTKIEDVGTPTEDEKKTVPREAGTGGEGDLQEGDNLSEFSDDGDEILDKNDELKQQSQQSALGLTAGEAVVGEEFEAVKEEERTHEEQDRENAQPEGDDDLTLDFEEISDGELEEESSKVKGLGDALGVDWAGLVAAAEPRESKPTGALKTTVKEMWEPKRIFRDVGISVRMAGRELAERLLGREVVAGEAAGGITIKREPLEEGEEENVKEEEQLAQSSADDVQVDLAANPIASCQVASRRRMLWRSNLIVNRSVASVAGVKPVALCARRDLQIRRRLCGLPAAEIELGGRGDEQQLAEMKALAREVFVKATAAVH